MKELHLAKWWETTEGGRLLCTLCPRYCKLSEGQNGFCYVRKNVNGKLYSLAYGRPTGFGIDPIEKKPLNHFLPGTSILSFGTAGCNLGCKFCQNWTMSKAKIDNINSKEADPETVIALAKKYQTPSIAFTYNDPTIFGEYVMDIAHLARQENLRTVMVTAGYIDKKARSDIYKNIDAANVDLKAFSEDFYFKLTSSHLNDVLDTLKWLKNETNVWLEITTLLIPGKNDDPDELKHMCDWIVEKLGEDVPLHFTAFHPDFKMRDIPPTHPHTISSARKIALRAGLRYCYVGNVHDVEAQTTYCPKCKEPLIVRDWHSVTELYLSKGSCTNCQFEISGVFT